MHFKFFRPFSLIVSFLVAIATMVPTLSVASAQSVHPVIVAYKDMVAARAGVSSLADDVRQNLQTGNRLKHTYSSVFKGYAADVTDLELAKLQADPNVSVTPDAKLSIYDVLKTPRQDSLLDALKFKLTGSQILPTGVNRIEADRSTLFLASRFTNLGKNLAIAVVDTGIAKHPDLNVSSEGIDCITGTNDLGDGFGHGTHVAGIIGALNNTTGVVGVAPGVTLISGRMFDANGVGTFGAFICVNDWIAQNAARLHIVAANMSLTGGQTSDGTTCANTLDGIHLSVCGLIKAGVVPVVAAGNEGHDFVNNIPANYPEVLTATAFDDEDGKPGNDFTAGFSNFATVGTLGATHEIAGPGVNILSTYLNGGYASLSGTSMSTPHVTGTLVDCIFVERCTGTPAQKIQRVLQDAAKAPASYGFPGDNRQPQGSVRYGFVVADRPN